VQQLIDMCLQGPQQQTRHMLLQQLLGGTDRQMDGHHTQTLSHTKYSTRISVLMEKSRFLQNFFSGFGDLIFFVYITLVLIAFSVLTL